MWIVRGVCESEKAKRPESVSKVVVKMPKLFVINFINFINHTNICKFSN